MATQQHTHAGEKHGRLEFKNFALFLQADPCMTEREFWDEAWFIAANIHHVPNTRELEYLGRLYSMVKNKGCVYDTAIMQRLLELEKNLFV